MASNQPNKDGSPTGNRSSREIEELYEGARAQDSSEEATGRASLLPNDARLDPRYAAALLQHQQLVAEEMMLQRSLQQQRLASAAGLNRSNIALNTPAAMPPQQQSQLGMFSDLNRVQPSFASSISSFGGNQSLLQELAMLNAATGSRASLGLPRDSSTQSQPVWSAAPADSIFNNAASAQSPPVWSGSPADSLLSNASYLQLLQAQQQGSSMSTQQELLRQQNLRLQQLLQSNTASPQQLPSLEQSLTLDRAAELASVARMPADAMSQVDIPGSPGYADPTGTPSADDRKKAAEVSSPKAKKYEYDGKAKPKRPLSAYNLFL